jgi:hypothetical protein
VPTGAIWGFSMTKAVGLRAFFKALFVSLFTFERKNKYAPSPPSAISIILVAFMAFI